MSHFIIVGQRLSSLGDYLLTHGHEYTFLHDIKKTKFPDKKFKRRIVTDFSSTETIESALGQIKSPVDGVLSTYEDYILPAAWIADHLGLPGMPVSAAEACTDKALMRKLFGAAPEKISPAYATVTTEDEVRDFASSHSFPLILKPANLSKSLLVTKNDSLDELVANYRKSVELLGTTYKKFAPNRTPKLLIEEYLDGSVHSVDAFVDTQGQPHILDQIVDYQTGYDIGYQDNFHYSRLLPSKLSDKEQEQLRHCAELGVKALGMKNSPAHIEIIMTKDGPRIVEIGARNGGYRERMHELANGIDITDNALRLALGQPVNVRADKNEPCAVLELLPKIPGNFGGIAHDDALKSLPSLHYYSVKAKPGAHVGKAADGYKMCAVAILHHSDSEQFEKDLTFFNQHVSVITTQ